VRVSCEKQAAPLDCFKIMFVCTLPADLWELLHETVFMRHLVQACIQAGHNPVFFVRLFEIWHMHDCPNQHKQAMLEAPHCSCLSQLLPVVKA
jgi:hypothetical protein